MQLISQLNEAADIPLEDLRAAVKKDKRVNKIFSKDLQLDEIENVKEFIDTLRFYVLNNRHVIQHVKNRNASSPRVNNWSLRSLRQATPVALTQKSLEEIQREVQDLFRDITSTLNTSYSNDTGQSLWGWINGMKGYRGPLSYHAVRELKTYPALRPSKPIVVYRGLLFDENSLKEIDSYDGTMKVGDGLKFLRSVREGKRIADVQFDEATKWFRNKESALDAAFNGDETWRSARDKIRGQLAFVVSMIADPSAIIVDTSMIPKAGDHKPVVVIDSGKYLVRIVHKFTPEGEVDPLATPEETSNSAGAMENLQMFAHVFKPPFPEPAATEITRGISTWEGGKIAELKALSDPSARAKILKSTQTVLDYYNTYLKDLPKSELNDLLANPTLGKAAQAAMYISTMMNDEVDHPTEMQKNRTPQRPARVPKSSLSAEELWKSRKYSSLKGSIPTLKMSEKTPRFRDWGTFSPLIGLMHVVGMPVTKDLHQKSGKVQHEEMRKLVDAFFSAFGEKKPPSQEAAVDRMHEIVQEYERNARLLEMLWQVRQLLDKLKD